MCENSLLDYDDEDPDKDLRRINQYGEDESEPVEDDMKAIFKETYEPPAKRVTDDLLDTIKGMQNPIAAIPIVDAAK